MPRLIDADALEKRHCEDCGATAVEMCKNDPVCATLMWVREAPTIDPESLRPHGRWEKVWGSWRNKQCNCCSAVFTFDVTMNYCPNCGAKMDLEEEDG